MQALFKARFEQALESQKLNIKKTEQLLRRMGVNPEDPVAMASIQRVASTFFNAIDKKEGSPYVFHGDKQPERGTGIVNTEEPEAGDEDSDQEELDRFIAEIEDAADKEWEEEEAAEQEESGRIRYWNREEFAGRSRGPEMRSYGDSSHGFRRNERDTRSQRRSNNSDDDDDDDSDQLDSEDDEIPKRFDRTRPNTRRQGEDFKRRSTDPRPQVRNDEDNELSDLDNIMWDSEDEEDAPANYISSSSDGEEDGNRTISASKQPRFRNNNSSRDVINNSKTKSGKHRDEDWDSD